MYRFRRVYLNCYACFLFLIIRRPPRSTRTDTLFPYTTLFRSSVTLTYKLSPEISAYARYAEGYKSGGYNLDFVSAASFPNGIEFDKETVKNYEVGLKGSVEGGRLTFALAGFIDRKSTRLNSSH